MEIEADVKLEVIEDSRHSTLCSCPIAKTINRTLSREPYRAIVDASVRAKDGHCTLEETTPEGRAKTVYTFDLPKEAQEFVKKWDGLKKVDPFTFSIALKEKGPRTCISGTL